jgi:ABC-type lipoprotein release transport system permease subunit
MIATDVPAKWMGRLNADFFEVKNFISTQVMDEARHAEVFRKRALTTGYGLMKAWVGINFRCLVGYYLEYHPAWVATGWYVVLIMMMTMLAGYGAARRAMRESVLEGIRAE